MRAAPGAPLLLTRHRSMAMLLVPALVIALSVGGAGVGRWIGGPDELEVVSGERADWTLPLAFAGAVVGLFVVA